MNEKKSGNYVLSLIMPLLYAWIADATGSLLKGYWIMVPCFLFMIWYSYQGHKIEYWKPQKNN